MKNKKTILILSITNIFIILLLIILKPKLLIDIIFIVAVPTIIGALALVLSGEGIIKDKKE